MDESAAVESELSFTIQMFCLQTVIQLASLIQKHPFLCSAAANEQHSTKEKEKIIM